MRDNFDEFASNFEKAVSKLSMKYNDELNGVSVLSYFEIVHCQAPDHGVYLDFHNGNQLPEFIKDEVNLMFMDHVKFFRRLNL